MSEETKPSDVPLVAPFPGALFDLTGRVAIVTGATRGLGRAIANGLAGAGASVVVTGRDAAACAVAEEALEADGYDALGMAADMGDPTAVDRLVDAAAHRWGRIDIVVNNAGVLLGMPAEAITPEALQESIDVNLMGPLRLVQRALPLLRESDQASVVNVVTSGVVRPSQGLSVYLVTKAALLMLTKTLALEFAGAGIRVNAIGPGVFETDMTANLTPEKRAAAVAGTPLGRMAAPAEIVGAALYLASQASSFMTGQLMLLDGGRSI